MTDKLPTRTRDALGPLDEQTLTALIKWLKDDWIQDQEDEHDHWSTRLPSRAAKHEYAARLLSTLRDELMILMLKQSKEKK